MVLAMQTLTQLAAQRCTFVGGSSQIWSPNLATSRTSRVPRFPASSSPRLIKIGAQANVTTTLLSRKDFPPDFIFGSGCSAFQIEGAPTSGGRGNTIWDSFVRIKGNIQDGSVHYPGCDFYNLYEEDIHLAKSLGCDAFRFSISWTRIFPRETGQESAEGIDYYNRVINTILKAGLTPFVTLFHWETPQYLEDDPLVLGFRTKNIVPHFAKFAEVCFNHFGDRVKHWLTVNEMLNFALRGYGYGTHAPGRCSEVSGRNCAAGDSSTEPYQVGHNLLLAHAEVYQIYNNKYKVQQQGVCGFNPVHRGAAPYSNSQEDKLATQRYLEFKSGWQVDPIVFGDYPKSMRDALGDRLPKFTKEESEKLKNSFDFLGHNYYTATFVKHADILEDPNKRWYINDGGYTEEATNENGEYIGTLMGPTNSWIYESASYLPLVLEWMDNRYGKIPCYITENGVMDKTPGNAVEAIDDKERITFIQKHLMHLSKAITDKGIDLKGYFYWSFIDVFEWETGFQDRFGLFRVAFDENPPKRTPKSSAKWFKEFLAS